MQAAEEMSVLRSRSPAHAHDLIEFTGELLGALGVNETPEEQRLRKVACYLADIGWRGHPDYRGEQSVDLVAYGSLTGVDHPGRAFLAEVLAVRYMGLKHKSVSQALLDLAGRRSERAGAAASARCSASPIRCRRRCPACCRASASSWSDGGWCCDLPRGPGVPRRRASRRAGSTSSPASPGSSARRAIVVD